MRHRVIRSAARGTAFVASLLWTMSLFGAVSLAFAAAVGNQVELKATHPAGVPFHNAPGGGQTFQRVPTGTVATVMDLPRGGSWLHIRLPDQRIGWMTARYVGRTIAGSPPPETSAERLVQTSPQHPGSSSFLVRWSRVGACRGIIRDYVP